MSPARIAELRNSIPHDEDFDYIRAEFDRALELALERLECVAYGLVSADEAFPTHVFVRRAA